MLGRGEEGGEVNVDDDNKKINGIVSGEQTLLFIISFAILTIPYFLTQWNPAIA